MLCLSGFELFSLGTGAPVSLLLEPFESQLLVQLKILKVFKKTFKQLSNGAPNDGFLPNTLNTLFRISRVLLDL